MAKVLSLLLAITIWYLIKEHLATTDGLSGSAPLRAIVVPDDPGKPTLLNKKKR